jgi:hypothetical protein
VIPREQNRQLWQLARAMRTSARDLESIDIRNRSAYTAARDADDAALKAFVLALNDVTQ